MFSIAFGLRTSTLSIALLLALLPGMSNAQAQAQTQLQRITLGAGMHLIETQLALTPEQRQIGLMWRKDLPVNEGMLFVFPDRDKQCMWMKNTLLPLSVAFIDDAGVILNVEDMQPQTENSHCSAKPARYALEMNLGWFKSKNLKPGAKITGLEKAGPPQ
jgi:uncharacterized membrane protein (UPF0127 family)